MNAPFALPPQSTADAEAATAPRRGLNGPLLRRPWRAPLFAQVLALLILSLIGSEAINLGIVFLLPPPSPDIFRVSEVAAAMRTPGQPIKARNGRILKAEVRPSDGVRWRARDSRIEQFLQSNLASQLGAPGGTVKVDLLVIPNSPSHRYIRMMRQQMGPDRGFQAAERAGDPLIVAPFQVGVLRDAHWTVLKAVEPGLLNPWQRRVLLWFGLSSLAITPIAYVFARRLSSPIASFARAAEQLGRDPDAPPFALEGPAELSAAAGAFNQMQERLRRYVVDRTAMVGAVAHDLRTPLTRLRFRIESAPEPLRTRMAADIDQMDAMISGALAFVRDASQPGERQPLELVSLVESIADEMAETGLDVQAEGSTPVVIQGDAVGLRRLIANLLDNAVKFGGAARARVYAEAGAAVLEVEDDGPGVPEAEHERVFEPFRRGEPSRSRETGGAGLGLAIVRSVARAHGGDATLENKVGGGLIARARLPI